MVWVNNFDKTEFEFELLKNLKNIENISGQTIVEVPEVYIRGMNLEDLVIVDQSGDEYNFVEIENINVKDERGTYEISEWAFDKFQIVNIPIFGNVKKSTYHELEKFFRENEMKGRALCALENQEILPNIKNFLIKEIDDFVMDFDKVTDYTGEEEEAAVQDYLRTRGGIIYADFVSKNKFQTVPLLKDQLSQLQEDLAKGFIPEIQIYDEMEEMVDLSHVVEITTETNFPEEAIAMSYLEKCCVDMGDCYRESVELNCISRNIPFSSPIGLDEDSEAYINYKSLQFFRDLLSDEKSMKQYIEFFIERKDIILRNLYLDRVEKLEQHPLYKSINILANYHEDFQKIKVWLEKINYSALLLAHEIAEEYWKYLDKTFFFPSNTKDKAGEIYQSKEKLAHDSCVYKIYPKVVFKQGEEEIGIEAYFYPYEDGLRVSFFFMKYTPVFYKEYLGKENELILMDSSPKKLADKINNITQKSIEKIKCDVAERRN